jgi:E3 ubiquitin-protein ligase ATL10/75/76/77/78
MVVLAVVLFALVVVAVLNTLARCRIIRRLRMQQQLPSPESQQQQQQQQQRHHKGLEKAEIEALPVITYGVDSSKLNVEELDVGSHDCVVCLSEYQKGEKLRLLPLCNHGFHLDCINNNKNNPQRARRVVHLQVQQAWVEPVQDSEVRSSAVQDLGVREQAASSTWRSKSEQIIS